MDLNFVGVSKFRVFLVVIECINPLLVILISVIGDNIITCVEVQNSIVIFQLRSSCGPPAKFQSLPGNRNKQLVWWYFGERRTSFHG